MASDYTATIDMKELRALVGRIKDVSPRVYRVLRQDLLEAGDLIAAKARATASQHSVSIAPTIRVRLLAASQRHGVGLRIEAGGADTPIAGLYEAGNKKGGGGTATTFRHPTYGNWDAPVDQPRYPYLRPAAIEMEEPTMERISFAIDNAVNTVLRAGA